MFMVIGYHTITISKSSVLQSCLLLRHTSRQHKQSSTADQRSFAMFEIVHAEKGDQIRTEHMFELVMRSAADSMKLDKLN